MKIINIGILAHVDAGKTTITENLLFKSGATRTLGRVEWGNTHTDTLPQEKARGITIKASTVSYNWKGIKVNIIDTPGHVDFVAEVERSLKILDGGILVVSAKEGVQSHTRVLFEVLKQHKIPTIIFINKLDRVGVDVEKLMGEIRKELSHRVISLSEVFGAGNKEVTIFSRLEDKEILPAHYEILCDLDDDLLGNYMSNIMIDREMFIEKLSIYAKRAEIYPVLMGVGIQGLGIEALLDGINQFLPVKDYDPLQDKEVSGIVYKVSRDAELKKSVYVRMYSGTLKIRDCFFLPEKDATDKITKIEILEHGKQRAVDSVSAGDVAIVTGLNHFHIGDFIGNPPPAIRQIELQKPTLRAKVNAEENNDRNRVFQALMLLAEEDPLLEVEMDPMEGEIYIRIYGEVQMEIIRSMLLEFYGVAVNFSETTTIYKETPVGIGVALANMGDKDNPYAAAVKIEIQPLQRGDGVRYVSEVTTGYLTKSFQNAVEEAVFKCCQQGLYGWEITDLLITLKDAKYDSVNSTPADFRNLTPMVFMEALAMGKTKLLEPIYSFELKVPKDVGGRAIHDIQSMRGEIFETLSSGEIFTIRGLLPLDTSKNYSVKIAGYTEGKGVFLTKFHSYKDIPENADFHQPKALNNLFHKHRYLLQKSSAIRSFERQCFCE